jgi:hypothetical protein
MFTTQRELEDLTTDLNCVAKGAYAKALVLHPTSETTAVWAGVRTAMAWLGERVHGITIEPSFDVGPVRLPSGHALDIDLTALVDIGPCFTVQHAEVCAA